MSLLICTPCAGGVVYEPYLVSCLNLRDHMGDFSHNWFTLKNESLITRGRNVCAASFLETEYEKMLFIDADIEFTPEDVGKLWAMDVDVAVGVYRMKKEGSKYAAWVDGELIEDLDQFDKPIPVDYAGTGFMMISRAALERLKETTLDYGEGDVGQCWEFFNTPISDGKTWQDRFMYSEDYYFSKRWRDVGGEVIMDPSIKLIHHGSKAYG